MHTNRPRIKVPFEPIDIIVDGLSVILLIVFWSYVVRFYQELPERIPQHFNAQGIADGYGQKSMLIWLATIATFMYGGLFWLNRYPHLHNYMVNITPDNALRNYRFSTRILRGANLLCVLLFTYIGIRIIMIGTGTATDLGRWFLPIVIGGSLLLPAVIIIWMVQLNKKK
jgi:uncharacterized membrane protein